jgi:hypothetical protein
MASCTLKLSKGNANPKSSKRVVTEDVGSDKGHFGQQCNRGLWKLTLHLRVTMVSILGWENRTSIIHCSWTELK